jgi:XTP/dITP diphosphohydrolase
MKLLFVTGNKNKFIEAERILKEYGIIIDHFDLPHNEVRAESCEEVARHSLHSLHRHLDVPFFVEDAGLFIEALNGFPGTFSAWVFKKLGNEGILKLMEGKKNRNAVFKSAVAVFYHGQSKIFSGEVKGKIALKEAGKEGFGFDPIFLPQGCKKTFAENEKLKLINSHRKNALDKMAGWLKTR